jgi:hypothetical protein
MTIQEKIAKESGHCVFLYKEGVFWIAYEQSACLVSQVKSFKATKKYIKSVSREVVSVGFPDSTFQRLQSVFILKEKTDTQATLESKEPLEPVVFETWKSQIPLRKEAERHPQELQSPLSPAEMSLKEKIRSFQLHQATPMDCMHFIEALQKN